MGNNRIHSDDEYLEYLKAYDEFYNKKLKLFKNGCPRLDSQFSESLVADYANFNLYHRDGFDGTDSNGKTCEVKGTGYSNTKVRFNTSKKADRVFWVRTVKPLKVIIYEIKFDYSSIEDKNGFFDLSKISEDQLTLLGELDGSK